jgi:uncharacterized protein YkwD
MAKIKTHTTDSHRTKPRKVNKKAFERVYLPYLPLIAAVSILLTFSANSGALQAAARKPFGKVLSYSTSMSIGGLLADTNAQRLANGAPALSLNSSLNSAAQAKADDMAARNYWSHYTPENNPPWIFVQSQGYKYQKLGENLATGFADEQLTINGWMASPAHRDNLLDSSFNEVGFGYADNPDYTAAGGGPMTIVVAFYGKPLVLSAATSSPAPPPVTQTQVSTAAPQPQTAPPSQPQDSPTPIESQQPSSAIKPATSDTAKADIAKPVTTSHLQLAVPDHRISPWMAQLSVLLAILIIGIWANKHIRAMHRFFMKGERYIIRHPLTDVGLVMMAAMLFILSQTAGLIQ